MKLLLHIGPPKTGTTSLQQFLYNNREKLSEAGFFLFDGIGAPNNIDLAAFFSSDPANAGLKGWSRRRGITNRQEKDAYFASRSFVEVLDRQIASASETHHTAIITSEHLSSALQQKDDVELCARFLLERFEVATVIFFVRDQVDLLPSRWSTELKSGGTATLNERVKESVRNQSLDYFTYAERWSQHFGRDNLACFLYDPAQNWDIRKNFSEIYLEAAGTLTPPSRRANRSFGAVEATVVRIINMVFPYWLPGALKPNERNLRAREFVSRFLADKFRPVRLSSRQARRVAMVYKDSNAQFFREYLSPGERLDQQ